MTVLLFLLSICVAAEPTPDLHVYRYALRTLGAAGPTSAADLPSHYVVARTFNEGVARLKPSPWYAASNAWSLVFEGPIEQRLRLVPWRINDLLVLVIGGERRVFLELKQRVFALGQTRFGLVELRFEGPSRLTTQVDRVTLVPLRFDVDQLNAGHHEYGRPVVGPTWARLKVFDVANETSPETLIRMMVPVAERRIALTPADDVGHARLGRFLSKNGISIDAVPPTARPEARANPGTGCVRHLRLVR